jgi:hypothetical protein
MPADRLANGGVESLLQALDPRIAIADLRRAALALEVALRALRIDDFLAAALAGLRDRKSGANERRQARRVGAAKRRKKADLIAYRNS